MRQLDKVAMFVLDDWGLQGFSAEGRRDQLELVEGHHDRKSIPIASKNPVQKRAEVIGELTIADAILDRVVHSAYQIHLQGDSQRKRNHPPSLGGSAS